MARDPFQNDHFLERDFDTSYEDAEMWQGALKTNEDAEGIVREKKGNLTRLRIFYLAVLAAVVLLSGRLLILQIFNEDANKALAEGNRVRETDIRAPRGVVYTANRTIVARNVANFEVTVTPSQLPRKEEERNAIYQRLAEPLKKSPEELKKAAEEKGLRYSQELLLADKLDRDSSVLLQVRVSDLPGVRIANNPLRQYDQPDQYAHVLGYTGRVSEDDLKLNESFKASDYVGKTGLEKVYEEELRGAGGKERVEVNAQGQAIKELASQDPTAGKSLVLGIDSDLQNAMYAAVDNGIKSSRKKATGGSAIAMNPKTGEILGMVSLPSFNNNAFVGGIKDADYQVLAQDERKPLFNRPVSGEYPPGSTFKIVTATAALGEGVVTPDTSISSPGSIDIQGYKFVDWDPNGHGTVNVKGAIAQSADVFFYKVSGGYGELRGVGDEKLGEYMHHFGIGNQTGIDLPDERRGLVPTRAYKKETFNEDWYIGNTYQMGIGQGFVLTTPLQVATYTATIANNGVAFKPHLVKAIENPDNPKDVQTMASQPLVNLPVDRDVIKTVQEGMRQAVKSGTGRELSTLPVEICGKTGSAEFANETNAHAWFTAYAPCSDPQIVVTVMIEGGGEGSDVAVPAAKRIFEQFFHIQASPAPRPEVHEANRAEPPRSQ